MSWTSGQAERGFVTWQNSKTEILKHCYYWERNIHINKSLPLCEPHVYGLFLGEIFTSIVFFLLEHSCL